MSLVRADAIRIPLRDESVDLVVTSPPYFALRSYRDNGEHFAGQIGSEATPQAFLEALWAVTAECMRVLKPSGSIFVNLGDKYAGSGGHNNAGISRHGADSAAWSGGRPDNERRAALREQVRAEKVANRGVGGGGDGRRAEQRNAARRNAPDRYNQNATFDGAEYETRAKSLMLLPERYRIGCVDRLGLIAREVIVWHKLTSLPESVTDRCRRSHEDWVHLTKEGRYFAAMDEIREEHAAVSIARSARGRDPGHDQFSVGSPHTLDPAQMCNPLGKLPGSVWRIPSEPLTGIPELMVEDETGWRMMDRRRAWRYAFDRWHGGNELPVVASDSPDHFAAFPGEWPRRLILGWSPSGICVACGDGRRPVASSRGLDMSRPQARRAAEIVAESGLTDAHIAAIRSVGLSDTGRGAATQNGTGKNTPEVYRLAAEARSALGGYAREFLLERPTVTGYACSCSTPDAPTRPAVILDPFAGTGTTVMVAKALGRFGVGLDLSADYLRLAHWRIEESGHGGKSVRRTFAERNRQVPMFDTEEATADAQ